MTTATSLDMDVALMRLFGLFQAEMQWRAEAETLHSKNLFGWSTFFPHLRFFFISKRADQIKYHHKKWSQVTAVYLTAS